MNNFFSLKLNQNWKLMKMAGKGRFLKIVLGITPGAQRTQYPVEEAVPRSLATISAFVILVIAKNSG